MVAGGALVVSSSDPSDAAGLPSGFSDTTVLSGLTLPMAIDFAPDGRVFLAEKSGLIKVFPNLGSNSPTVFKDLRSRVFDFWDRGLMSIALHPRFGDGSGHDFLYALYAKDAPPGQSPPYWNDSCPDPPGGNTDGCVVTGTLSRIPVLANGTGGAEQPLIDGEWCQQFTTHSVGDLRFGPDGYLYVTGGEGAGYLNGDYGQFGGSVPSSPTPANPCGDPPAGFGVANPYPQGRGGALRAQSPRRPGGEPRLLSGTLLRVDPESGRGVPGNPLYDAGAPAANASRIVAYGMRNPFRFTLRPGTEEVWIGDVGWGLYEEVNRVPGVPSARAYNFGWPCLERTTRVGAYRDLDVCKQLYADTADPARDPYFAYLHGEGEDLGANDTCDTGANGASISALAFYTGTRYPAAYRDALFLGDYSRNCIWVMTKGTNGLPDTATVRTFVDDSDSPFPVDLKVEPTSGDLVYVNIALGTVHRITYGGGGTTTSSTTTTPNSPPQPVINAPSTGTTWAAGDLVRFSGGATDTEDGPLPATGLVWTVAVKHCTTAGCHEHVLATTPATTSGKISAPAHEAPSGLVIRLTATDSDGASATATREITGRSSRLTFRTDPPGLQLTVGAAQAKAAPFSQDWVVGSPVQMSAAPVQDAGGATYEFTGWSDGGQATHTVVTPDADTTYTARYEKKATTPQATKDGYWMVARNGAVYAFGGVRHHGNAPTNSAADLEPTKAKRGYWIVDDAGRVYAFGDARHLGNAGALPPGERVTSISRTPSGSGYWIFTTRGRVIARGDAPFLGDMRNVALNGPVLDSIPTPSGAGYYMVGSDGGVFAFGNARFAGSMGGVPLNRPVQSLVPDGDGSGYWLVASDGGIFAFAAPFRGSMGGVPLNKPITGMVRYGNGYLMVGEDGGIFNFSDRQFAGSLGSNPPPVPIVSVAS